MATTTLRNSVQVSTMAMRILAGMRLKGRVLILALSFDYFGVFIFSCGVERNAGFNGFVAKRSKLPVSTDLPNDETALLVHSTHSEETGQERFRFDVEEELSCSILDLSGNGVEEAKTIDPKHVHFEDNVLVVLDDCFRYVQNFREGWNAGLVLGFAAKIGHRGSVDCLSDSNNE